LSELRKDPTTRRWAIIATDRWKRPGDLRGGAGKKVKRACPFDPGSEEIKKAAVYLHWEHPEKWFVSVLPNKFPALSYEGLPKMKVKGMYTTIDAVGGHELFVDTPRHRASVATMSLGELEAVLNAYRERYKFWMQDDRVKYVLIFKNQGKGSGASLVHPHTQLAATPVVPPRVLEELEKGERYFKVNHECIYCDMIKDEINGKQRLVRESRYFIAMCPFASRFPFELMILPKRHSSNFIDMDFDELKDLAQVISWLFKRVKEVLSNPPFNSLIHVGPQYAPNLRFFHWHIEIIPRLTEVAGFEWGAGVYINPTPPEAAAQILKSG
jgi:UDPglucose--hexose-1-phosphate uridylyltransferase